MKDKDNPLYRITKHDPQQPHHKDVRYGGKIKAVQVMVAAVNTNKQRLRYSQRFGNYGRVEYLPVTVTVERMDNITFVDVSSEFSREEMND